MATKKTPKKASTRKKATKTPTKSKKGAAKKPVQVGNFKHKDKRVNIPTSELASMMAEDEASPQAMLYPRDPSLDPQLVWKGKDEQDQQDLEVPIVPVYIQEKIHPRVIVEQVREEAKTGQPQQADMFSDFNGIKFEDLIDFYQHEQNWTNRMILGDSLLVMNSLAEKEGLKGKVQMIYMDPPYGIKFGSNWQVSTRKRDVNDGKVADASREPEVIKAFRDTWALGIHSYLTYLRDRFLLARELLTESGTMLVQIGIDNAHLVRNLLEEVFGSENHVATIVFTKTSGSTGDLLAGTYDLIIAFAKSRERVKFRSLFHKKEFGGQGSSAYGRMLLPDGGKRALTPEEKAGVAPVPSDARVYRIDNLTSQSIGREKGEGAASWFPVELQGAEYRPNARSRWKTNEQGMARLLAAGRIESTGSNIYYVRFMDDFIAFPVTDQWTDTVIAGFASDKKYVVETSTKVVERCLLMFTDPGDIVLDPTCGSGTTAHVAEQCGRRWITVDTSRVALTLARARLMASRYPYYLLADSRDGLYKEAELTGRVPPEYKTENDVRKGFVYQRVPHIMLKDIANNAEIDEIHARWQEKLEPLLGKLNKLTKQKWAEWEVPRELDRGAPAEANKLLKEWWELRRRRQEEIDASIARHSDVELLYDQPYEDPKKVRVTGPFTVESLSPHRVLSDIEERPESEEIGQRDDSAGDFTTLILENLRKAGVQNARKNERLKFEALDPHPGRWIHAVGDYTDKEGSARRVAVTIGPEHGTVGQEQIREAAKEAMHGVGHDVLLVLGFAFDPMAGETARQISPELPRRAEDGFAVAEEERQYGKLPVLLVRMNPDLAMGDELLKKTGSGNLFMVFGEPDIRPLDPKTGKIKPGKDGKVVVEIKGVDVYDPTTGQIRNSSTDDIACWFIDTNYNGESFFVRHAYFTGADQPYEKLKRALRAEIDEEAWAALYTTESRPFDPPKTGKIAIKVINHYGDEVLKVYEVG